uniref:Uncharacterized protein n=1 Tax=Sphaerodactylus townsendi TaxID=933632 RepID=A0ACB8F3S0_9SAUR
MGDGDKAEIDGGIMEGGGQILRVTTALSCLLRKPLQVKNIRAGRSQPGLRPPASVRDWRWFNTCVMGSWKVEKKSRSTEITFTPGKIKGWKSCSRHQNSGECLILS